MAAGAGGGHPSSPDIIIGSMAVNTWGKSQPASTVCARRRRDSSARESYARVPDVLAGRICFEQERDACCDIGVAKKLTLLT